MRLALCLFALMCAPVMAEPPLAVKSRPLSELVHYPQREAQAQVVSLNLSRLSAQINARIDSILVEPGQRIARGAVIARLDCRDYQIAAERAQAALESAQARHKLAQLQLQRSTELAAQNFISGDALDAKKTEMEVISAEVKLNLAERATARRDVEKCTLRSPFPAIVDARLAQVGELASPGTPLVQLWDSSKLQLSVQVPQALSGSLTAAKSPVFVSQGREYPVKLLRISPALNPASRMREARFDLGNTKPAPGSHGVLRWRDDRPHLAAEYLLNRGGRLGVFVLEGQKARFVPLAEAQEGRPAPVALPPATRLITDGRFALQDGTTVRATR
jgi:RND family efflux transporter MFP subunit